MDIRYKDEVVIVFMQNNVTFATFVLVKRNICIIIQNNVREFNYTSIKKENISYDAFYIFWRRNRVLKIKIV